MCELCEIKKAIGEFVGLDVKKVLVGKIDLQLIADLNLAENEVEKIKADSGAELLVLKSQGLPKAEVIGRLTEKYQEKYDAAVDHYNEVWNKIYTAVGVAGDKKEGSYTIDRDTGELFLEVVEEIQVTAQGVH